MKDSIIFLGELKYFMVRNFKCFLWVFYGGYSKNKGRRYIVFFYENWSLLKVILME